MKKEALRSLLAESLDQRRPLALLRKKLGVPPLYCVPLAQSGALLLAALYTDFQYDGFAAIRLDDITGARAGAHTDFHARIMDREGLLPLLSAPPLPLEDFPSLLRELHARREPVIVMGEGEAFLLGIIEKAGKNKLFLRYIGTDGRIDDQITRIAYEDITSVGFGGRYLSLVARHASPSSGGAAFEPPPSPTLSLLAEPAYPPEPPAPEKPAAVRRKAPSPRKQENPAPDKPRKKPGPKPKSEP